MNGTKNQSKPWRCENCDNALAGKTDDINVEFRAIGDTEVEYMSITAKCNKCGHKQIKLGKHYNDYLEIKKTLEFNQATNKTMLAVVDILIDKSKKQV